MAISPKQFEQVVLYAPRQSCPIGMGVPGVAKSAMIWRAARRANAAYVCKYTATLDPVDVRLPYLVQGPDKRKFLAFAPPGDWPTDVVAERYPESEIIINLDDLGQAIPGVQKPIARTVYGDGNERMLGDAHVLPNVRFAGTSNREQDRAGANRFLSYLANRVVPLQIEPDVDEWVAGAIDGFSEPGPDADYPELRAKIDAAVELGIPDSLIAYAKWTKSVCNFTPDSDTFMSPRSLADLGRFMRAFEVVGLNGAILAEVASGTIGEAEAAKFMAFHKLRDELPDTDAILRGEDVPLPAKTEVLYILVTAIVRAARAKHTAAVAKLVKRLAEQRDAAGMNVGVEISAYLFGQCLHGSCAKEMAALKMQPDMQKWLQSNYKYFVDSRSASAKD